jgi:phosphoribosyl 1,2-cyclic phosphodiesterase
VRVWILGSGSSGNCLVVESSGERLIIDAGMNPTRAIGQMRALGGDLMASRGPLGLFITHDHGDHSAHALPLARALRAPLFAHDGALLKRARSRVQVGRYAPGKAVALGPFVVEALAIPHDAPHVALRVSDGDRRFAIATDLGHVARNLRFFLSDCDIVLLESNHCPELLQAGPYPPRLKQRVAGPLGHLANQQAAELAVSLQDTRVCRLVLAHLSRSNNTPDRALDVVRSRAHRLSVEALPHAASRLIEMDGRGTPRMAQLAFAF